MLACAQPEGLPAGGVDVVLTSFGADPWAGTDAMRVDVRRGDELLASVGGTPGGALEIPDLADFGEVSIDVLGLAGGEVVAAGSTGPMVVGPERKSSIEVLFLPVNEPIAVPGDVDHARLGGVGIAGLDGRIRFWGGRDDGGTPTSSGDVFTFANGFADVADILPSPVADPASVRLPDAETWIAGGDGQASASSHVIRFDPYGIPDVDIDGHVPVGSPCAAAIGWDRAAIIATNASSPQVTFVVVVPDGVVLETAPPRVAACGGLDDGRVVTAGDASAWGLLDVENDRYTPFTAPLELDGTIGIPDGDRVWFVGGSDGSGTFSRGIPVTASGPGAGVEALAVARTGASHVRWRDRYEVVFGGTADAAGTTPAHAFEWWEIGVGTALSLDVPIDAPTAVALPGGALLLRGEGFDGPAAYAVMPWLP